MNKKNFILIFFLVLFFMIPKIEAYNIFNHNGTIYNEESIYNEFLKIDGFDINQHSKIYCTYPSSDSNVQCYALHKDTIISDYTASTTIKINVVGEDCVYYYLSFSKYNTANNIQQSKSCSSNASVITLFKSSNNNFSNFNFDLFDDEQNNKFNVLDFSSFMSEDIKPEEMEIIEKSNNLLSIILSKTSSIYDVLIGNEIFKLCLGVILSYIAFIIIYKIIKR